MAFVFADEILDTCRATDDTFRDVRELLSPRETVELALLIGYFRMISGLMTTLDVDVDAPFGVKLLDLAHDVAPRRKLVTWLTGFVRHSRIYR